MIRTALCAASCLASASALPAMADDTTSITPNLVFELARGYGSAELDTSGEDPMISGRIEGVKYAVYMYGCKAVTDECTSLRFYAGWVTDTPDRKLVNDFNRDFRFAKSYVDNDEDIVLEMDANLRGGVSRSHVDDQFDWWRIVLEKFTEQYHGE